MRPRFLITFNELTAATAAGHEEPPFAFPFSKTTWVIANPLSRVWQQKTTSLDVA